VEIGFQRSAAGSRGTASAASCCLVKNTSVTSSGFKAGEAHYTVDRSSGYVIVSGTAAKSVSRHPILLPVAKGEKRQPR
jgi:hypothetical protein